MPPFPTFGQDPGFGLRRGPAVLAIPPLASTQDVRRRMRIIVFGAHPDDCELEAAGTAARWAKLGHKVKFVSVTNGDIGHHEMAGAILARRRTAEVKRCAEILGIETEVLDIHDGELLPTLENRRTDHPQDPRVAGRRRDRATGPTTTTPITATPASSSRTPPSW